MAWHERLWSQAAWQKAFAGTDTVWVIWLWGVEGCQALSLMVEAALCLVKQDGLSYSSAVLFSPIVT